MVRQRRGPRPAEPAKPPPAPPPTSMPDADAGPRRRRLGAHWILFAVASGACAAVNGVFAKLTTTGLTSTLSSRLVALLRLSSSADQAVQLAVRGAFFALNLSFNGVVPCSFNGVMWSLFTTALARAQSTTHVSVINTSANFVLTALLGLLVFAEALPPLWWAGAALLVAGNVIVARDRDAGDAQHVEDTAEASESKPHLGPHDAVAANQPDDGHVPRRTDMSKA